MRRQHVEAFAEYARTNSKQFARLITAPDGAGVLRFSAGHSFVRFELTGRPDGLRPNGRASTLQLLRERTHDRGAASRLRPQDWMELEREHSLYQQRSRAALLAAVDACFQGRGDVALRLCQICRDDVQHLRAILEFAAAAHPGGRLPGASATAITLSAQACVADALECLAANGAEASRLRLRQGAAALEAQSHASHDSDPSTAASVQRLKDLAARLEEASAEVGNGALAVSAAK
jgi:hypothetical protein